MLRLTGQAQRLMVDCGVKTIFLRKLAKEHVNAEEQARSFSSFPNVRALVLCSEGLSSEGMMHFISFNRHIFQQLESVQAECLAVLFSQTWDVILNACNPSVLAEWKPCAANRRLPVYIRQVLQLATHPDGCGLTGMDLSLSSVRDEDMQVITKHCHKIKVLDISRCASLTDDGLAACGQLKDLQTLNVDQCKFTGEGFNCLRSLTELTRLTVGWCVNMSIKGCQAVAGLPAVQELIITKHPHSFQSFDALVEDDAAIQHSLTRLYMEASVLTPASMQVLSLLPSLYYLDVSGCTLQYPAKAEGALSHDDPFDLLNDKRRRFKVQMNGIAKVQQQDGRAREHH